MRATSSGGRSSSSAVARGELRLDLLAQRLEALLVQQDLDARLELVVAPAFEIVDAQDRLDIAEQVALGQELAHLAADERRAPEAAADIDGKAELARVVAHDLKADVVRLDHRAVVRRAVDRDLELARQERELRMERRPLPQDLGVGARIGDLVVGDAGEMVGGDVADAVAGGLDRVHLDAGELGENVGRVLQRRPVELDVLPRGEMAVAAVVAARDVGELAHLARSSACRRARRCAACRNGAADRARSSAGAGGTALPSARPRGGGRPGRGTARRARRRRPWSKSS